MMKTLFNINACGATHSVRATRGIHSTPSARSLMAAGFALLMASGLASCANDDIAEPQPNPNPNTSLTLTINCALDGKTVDSRASVDYGNTDETAGEIFHWNAGDSFYAYPLNTNGDAWVKNADGNELAPVRFNIAAAYSEDHPAGNATFTGTFAAAGTYQMLALYPATSAFTPAATAPANGSPATFAFTVPATEQTQSGPTTTHLKDNALMYATTTQPFTVGTQADGAQAGNTSSGMTFRHLTTMMRFTVSNKSAAERRVTAIGITSTGKSFGTSGTLTQTAAPWGAAPVMTYTADKTVNAISLATRAADDATKGISFVPVATGSATDITTFDAYLITLPGDELTGQTLAFTLTTTDANGQNPRTYTSRELSADLIIAANKGVKTFEAGMRYWFNLDLDEQLSISSFTVSPWADGGDMPAENTQQLKQTGIGANGAPIYEIRTADALKAFADIINGTDDGADRTFCGITIPGLSTDETRKSNARLMADIDLSSLCGANIGGGGKSWTPIGKSYFYMGVFDGNLHTVKGLYIKDERSDINGGTTIYYGLFGYLNGATVQHLTVEGSITATLTTTQGADYLSIYAGGIAGYTYDLTTLTDCHSAVQVAATSNNPTASGSSIVYAGGSVGYVSGSVGSRLSNCSSTGAVTATASGSDSELAYAGGICGHSYNTSFTGCSHNTGAVSATTEKGETYAGGVVGRVFTSDDPVQLLGCTNTAAVSGQAIVTTSRHLFIGGVTGESKAEIAACSNSGAITYNAGNKLYAGGLVGRSLSTVVASFSTQVPTVSVGGSKGTESYIGGAIGYHTSNTIPVSTCFYVSGSAEGLGTNGIGGVIDGSVTVNTDGGILATPAALNAKVDAMNATIDTYNGIANPCRYYWIKSAAAPQVRKK